MEIPDIRDQNVFRMWRRDSAGWGQTSVGGWMMRGPADFGDASVRHWEDAEHLFQGHRWANADHLYGFSAECSLKAVLLQMDAGVKTDPGGSPAELRYRQHVHRLWGSFRAWVETQEGEHHAQLLPSGAPFEDWSPDDRYAHRDNFSESEVRLHREAARRVLGIAAAMESHPS